ncbi:MAG: ribonuclease P protein component [Candidatus Berkelbacteria bacterium]
MLNNINRLRKAGDIQKVFKFGKSARSANFSIRYNPNRVSNNRFAVVVGTKVDKRATRRNAIKRLVREVIRLNIQSIPTSFDIVLTAHKLANWPIKLADVQPELTELLQKIR